MTDTHSPTPAAPYDCHLTRTLITGQTGTVVVGLGTADPEVKTTLTETRDDSPVRTGLALFALAGHNHGAAWRSKRGLRLHATATRLTIIRDGQVTETLPVGTNDPYVLRQLAGHQTDEQVVTAIRERLDSDEALSSAGLDLDAGQQRRADALRTYHAEGADSDEPNTNPKFRGPIGLTDEGVPHPKDNPPKRRSLDLDPGPQHS